MGASPRMRVLRRDGRMVKLMRGHLTPTGSGSPFSIYDLFRCCYTEITIALNGAVFGIICFGVP